MSIETLWINRDAALWVSELIADESKQELLLMLWWYKNSSQIDVKEKPQQRQLEWEVWTTSNAIQEVKNLLDNQWKEIKATIHNHYINEWEKIFHAFELSDMDKQTYRDQAKDWICNHLLAFHNTATWMVYYKRFYVHKNWDIVQAPLKIWSYEWDVLCIATKQWNTIDAYNWEDAKKASYYVERGIDYKYYLECEAGQKQALQEAIKNFSAN